MRFSSLRFRLILLVLLAVLPALGLIFRTAAEQRRTAALDAKENALRIATLASASQERLVEGARQLLTMMAQLPEVAAPEGAAANALLQRLRSKFTHYANFGVINGDGTVFASAIPFDPDINVSDRSYFRDALKTGNFAMGDYQIGRITKKASVNFGYPLLDQTGRARRVIFAALDLAWLERLAAEAKLPEGAALRVVDRAGIILAGWPEPERWRGRLLNDERFTRMVQQRASGTSELVGDDRVARLVAYTPLEGARGAAFVTVSISIPREVAYADANHILRQNLIWLIVVTFFALLAAWFGGEVFVLRKIRALLDATRRLAEGDLSARTGIHQAAGELSQLASAFDQMAETLQARNAERDHAEASLKQLNDQLEFRVAERTVELRSKNSQLESDLDLAREFQIALLPERDPTFTWSSNGTSRSLKLFHVYIPSGSVGGDFFHVLPISDRQTGIFLCDVMGHGVRSALMTAIIRGLVEELRGSGSDPGKFLQEINRSLAEVLRGSGETIFATAFFVVIDLANLRLSYANAGHPHPFHLQRSRHLTTRLPFLGSTSGPALGIFPGTTYQTVETELATGDAIVIHTDGVFEVENAEGDEFGEERLQQGLSKAMDTPLPELLPGLVESARGFSADGRFADDVCLVSLEVTGEG